MFKLVCHEFVQTFMVKLFMWQETVSMKFIFSMKQNTPLLPQLIHGNVAQSAS